MNNWLRISHLFHNRCYLCYQTATGQLALCDACRGELAVIPNGCRQCGLPISADNQAGRCGHCLKTDPPYDLTLSAYIYAEPINHLITRMKFSGNLALARLLGLLLRDHILPAVTPLPEAILPVPLHDRRLKERGFNQSLELARPLARQLQLPLLTDQVRRRVATPSQTGLSKQQRRANLRRAFEVVAELPYEHIAIVDDVITTGETVVALAGCLKKSGVKRVDCWSVARALPAGAK